jgi:hypothetical protein
MGIYKDTFYIFVDIDRNQDTGYKINELGADYLVSISGHANSVTSSDLHYFDGTRSQDDWNGWTFFSQVPSKCGYSELETKLQIYGVSDPTPSDLVFYASAKDGMGNSKRTTRILR